MKKKSIYVIVATTMIILSACNKENDPNVIDNQVLFFQTEIPTVKGMSLTGDVKQLEEAVYHCEMNPIDSLGMKGVLIEKRIHYFDDKGMQFKSEAYQPKNEGEESNLFSSTEYKYDSKFRMLLKVKRTFSKDDSGDTIVKATKIVRIYDEVKMMVSSEQYITDNEGNIPWKIQQITSFKIKPDGTYDPTDVIEVSYPRSTQDDLYLQFKQEHIILGTDDKSNWLEGYKLTKTYDKNGNLKSYLLGSYYVRKLYYY